MFSFSRWEQALKNKFLEADTLAAWKYMYLGTCQVVVSVSTTPAELAGTALHLTRSDLPADPPNPQPTTAGPEQK